MTKKYQIHEHYLTKNRAYVSNSPLNNSTNSAHVHKIRITYPQKRKGRARGE